MQHCHSYNQISKMEPQQSIGMRIIQRTRILQDNVATERRPDKVTGQRSQATRFGKSTPSLDTEGLETSNLVNCIEHIEEFMCDVNPFNLWLWPCQYRNVLTRMVLYNGMEFI